MKKRLWFVLFVLTFCTLISATTLVSWDFSGYAGSETSGNAMSFADNISTIAPSGVIARGTGLTAAANADRFNATSWNTGTLSSALTGNDYMSFSIAPASSYKCSITSLHMRMQRSSTGPVSFTVRSSVDAYATDLGSFTVTSSTTSMEQTLTIAGISNQTGTITFQIYGYGASSTAGSAGFEGTGNDLEIIGTVDANYTAPVITTTTATSLLHYGFTSGGNVTSDGGSPVTARGVVVSLATDPVLGGVGVSQFAYGSGGTGTFSVAVTGLSPSQSYYYRAYATNNGGTTYGNQLTVTTASFPAPILSSPTGITNTSFRANWQSVVDALNYRLDVATSSTFGTGSSTVLVNEGFASGATAPSGWTFNGIASTYTSSGYYGTASPSIKFDNTGDYVETPTLSLPTSLSFWVKGTSTSGASAFLVEEYYGSSWHTVANLTPSGTSPLNLPTSGTVKTFALSQSSTKVRFSYTKDAGNVGLDDILINSDLPSSYVTGFQDLTVSTTYKTVTGLSPNTKYYYRVRAYSITGNMSTNSTIDSVTVVFSGTVEPPVDVTATAFNSSTINLSITPNSVSDNVMVAYSTSNVFGTPSGAYSVGNSIVGGGTVCYKGTDTSYAQNGLNPNTHYYYRAWSVDLENHYSSPISADAATPAGSSERIKVHFIDVKQGDCALIQRGTHNYLIDAGKDLTDNKVITYLQSLGVTHLDACMISHPDFDHYAEFVDLLESGTVTVDRFIKNSDNSTAQTWATLMGLISSNSIPLDIVDSSSNLNWAVETQILNPPPTKTSENDRSIVMKMTYGNVKFLFTGDMETTTNTYITNNYDVNIDVLKVSHHGSINGTTSAFLAEATPAISIISSGANSFGHPSYAVIDLLQNCGSLIYSTADDWNTWTGNGSSDDTDDDDIILETDGTNVWKNGSLVWTQTGTTVLAPSSLDMASDGVNISIGWVNIADATYYAVFASNTPYSGFTDISSQGTFETVSGRTTWTTSVPSAVNARFFYVKSYK